MGCCDLIKRPLLTLRVCWFAESRRDKRLRRRCRTPIRARRFRMTCPRAIEYAFAFHLNLRDCQLFQQQARDKRNSQKSRHLQLAFARGKNRARYARGFGTSPGRAAKMRTPKSSSRPFKGTQKPERFGEAFLQTARRSTIGMQMSASLGQLFQKLHDVFR